MDFFKHFFNFGSRNNFDFPRNPEYDERNEDVWHMNGHHEDDFQEMFHELDQIFENMFGSVGDRNHFHFELPQSEENHENKSLRDKILGGNQDSKKDSRNQLTSPFREHHHSLEEIAPFFFGFQMPSLFPRLPSPPLSFGNPEDSLPNEDQDLDGEVNSGKHSIDNILSFKQPSLNEDLLCDTQRQYSTFKYSSTTKRTNADGTVETRSSHRDSDGNEEVVISRSLGEKTHTFTNKKNKDGAEETTENFINMNPDDLKQFENEWKEKPGSDLLAPPDHKTNWLEDYFSSWWKPKL